MTIKLGLLIFAILSIFYLQAQTTNDFAYTGVITGKAKDSVYKFVLSSATVAVYRRGDSSLVNFSLPNNFGEFSVDRLPVNTPLQLVITHVGFVPFNKNFQLSPQARTLDIGWVYMNQMKDVDENDSNSVVVTSVRKAPMRMNGDTVEFNADAFRLDSNATAEDLMRRLPGFTIWGDGDITYNGKQVNAVYVDGKPFLGGTDVSAATQNLPKDAIDKIQVYQQRNDKNPLDSMMFANIKIKEDKKMGHFGKVSAGGGTGRHYALDGMLTFFNKKMQASLVGAMNDINKMANSTDTLIKYSSYKGVGANTDYQSDFSMAGLNKTKAFGGKFQYDFIEDVQYQNSSRMNADGFYRRNDKFLTRNSISNTMLGTDSILSSNTSSNQDATTEDGTFNATYARSSRHYSLNANAGWQYGNYGGRSESNTEQYRTGAGLVSASRSVSESHNRSNTFNGGISYTHNDNPDYSYDSREHRIPTNFTVGYNLSVNNSNGSSRNLTDFKSYIASGQDQNYDRLYSPKDAHTVAHDLDFQYPNLNTLLFGRHYMAGIQMYVGSHVKLTNADGNNVVLDRDTTTGQYVRNDYLTNRYNRDVTDITPSLTLSKTFYKGLTNRYNKSLSLNLKAQAQYYRMHNEATQDVQDIGYRYWRFVPTASVAYYNHQYGSYEIQSNLNWDMSAGYPTLNNLVPLVDSSNVYNLYVGNRQLRPEQRSRFAFSFDIKSRTPKNPISLSLSAALATTADNITDSTVVNSSGQSIIYAVNMDGSRSFDASARLRKSLEWNKNTLQLTASYSYYAYRSPTYYNNVLNISNSTTNNGMLQLNYSYLDKVTLWVEQSLSYNLAKQEGYGSSAFKSNNKYTRFSGALQLPKNLVWSSNITYNRSVSGSSDAVNYTIWNASLTYRFLHGNRGEVKFSAMDLLHQNKGITNTARYNNQTFSSTNVLQQYFMLTFSYFSRKFGR
ncbi:MAG: outer membrane beta-barrel protein [Chitinophagaceae bacterium]